MACVERLQRMRSRDSHVVLGLNSGTSADAIDGVLVRFTGRGDELSHSVLACSETPWPVAMRRRLLSAGECAIAEGARLHSDLGCAFAEAALQLIHSAGLRPENVDLIGSHGQTVVHLPGVERGVHTVTLQLGDLDIIAERTGIVTVGDFRARDTAAGGQGAPLMPFLDWVLFRKRPGTVCLNLGGIANITWVAADIEECLAFDTGPANMPMDLLAEKLSQGAETYDPGGRFAEQGHVDAVMLERLMRHPYLHREPPKTTGREEFGKSFVDSLLLRERHLALVDILATVTAFVADSIAEAISTGLPGSPREVVVSGGGLHNLALMRRLRARMSPVPVTSLSDYGIEPDSKEALLFALLARDRVLGAATNVPRATGAKWPVGLGKIAL